MTRFEYKLVAAPDNAATKSDSTDSSVALIQSLNKHMDVMGRDGWQFLRTETVSNRVKTGVLFSKVQTRDIMVFQRPLPVTKTKTVAQTADVETKSAFRSNSNDLRSRINRMVQAEKISARKQKGKRPSYSPFEIISSLPNN